MPTSWDDIARSYDRVSRGSRVQREKLSRVASLVKASGATRLLDLGCGSGLLEARLYAEGFGGSVTAVDSSPGMVALARRATSGLPVTVEQVDLDGALPYADGSFDGAVAVNVLFLLRDPASAAREVRRVLEPGSPFIVVIPKPDARPGWVILRDHFSGAGAAEVIREAARLALNARAVIATARFRRALAAERERTGERMLTRDEAESLLTDAGFTPVATTDIQSCRSWLFECVAR